MMDSDFDPRLREQLWDYGGIAVQQIDARAFEAPVQRRSAIQRLAAAAAVVALAGALSWVGLGLLGRGTVGNGTGLPPATSCAEMATNMPVSCADAQASVSWGPNRIDSTRIWLTSLGAMKAAMSPPQQVSEPPDSTPVWVFVYDGRWTCCLVGGDEGVTGPTDHSRWLHVVDATRNDGSFIYIHDWSGKDVPVSLPAPD